MDIEFLEKAAKAIMQREKHHIPMIFLISRDKELSICGLAFRNRKGKNIMCDELRKKVQEEKIPQYFVVMEGWLSSNPHIMPSNDINRKETLIVSEFNSSMKRRVIIIPFSRSESNNIIWHNKIDLPDDDGEQYNQWDFYRVNVMEEVFEKTRKEALLKELEETDLKMLIEKTKKDYEKQTGNAAPPEFNEVSAKELIRKLINEGKVSKKVKEINDDRRST